MCLVSTPKVSQIAATTPSTPPPPPADTATALREPGGTQRDSSGQAAKRKGRAALIIPRSDAAGLAIPSTGSGLNA